jgi:pilus assembly protein CpaB
MRSKAVIPLVLGLGMGFLAIKMGISVLKRAKAKPVETTSVVVTAKPIEAAAAITESMLKVAEVPTALVPPGSFRDIKGLIGRVPQVPVTTGIPLSTEMLAPEGAEPGLPSQIPNGLRAVSMSVDEATAVGGFVMPGHRVDVYAQETAFRTGSGEQRAISKLLLEDVQVGAVGQSIRTVDPDGKTTRLTRSVTLYVRPEDVAALDVAARAQIRLALRGSQDRGKVSKTKGPTMADMLATMLKAANKPAPPPRPVVTVAPPAPKPFVVEVYHGQAVERIEFAGPATSERVNGTAGNNRGNTAGPPDAAWLNSLTDGRVPPPVTQQEKMR